MTRRLAARLAAAGFLAGLGLMVTAPPALAHAVPVSTSPADGSVVRHAPTRVTVTFDEPVGVSADSLRVFAPNGSRADSRGTGHGSNPQTISVALLPGLGPGTYTVSWHVISADSHPVQGAFTFSIGAPSSTVVTPTSLGPPGSKLVGAFFGLVRFLAFCCFALLAGAVAFVIWCWPAGASRPAVLRLAMGAWGGLALTVLAALLLQGVYGASQNLGHVFWPNVLHATLYSRYGRALGVRLLLVIAALFAFSITLGGLAEASRRARIVAGAAWGVVTAALAATWALADHSGTGIQVPLAAPADIIHLSAMATWVGGLIMLVAVVLRSPASDENGAGRPARRRGQAATVEAARAVVSFSPIALGCVVAMLVTGTYMAWRNVGITGGLAGTWGALTGTTYGRLLLIKIGGMGVLICLGYVARRKISAGIQVAAETSEAAVMTVTVPQARVRAGVSAGGGRAKAAPRVPPAGPPEADWPVLERAGVSLRRLRWSVAAETTIAAVVIAATAVLVNTPTARETYFPPVKATVAFNTGGPGGKGSIALTVTPVRVGPNQFRVSITGIKGTPYHPAQITAGLSLPARHLGPLAVTLTPAGPGRYVSQPVVVSTAGQWQIAITVRSDAFDETTVTVPISFH